MRQCRATLISITAAACGSLAPCAVDAQPGFPEHFQEVANAVQGGVEQAFFTDDGSADYAAASIMVAQLHEEYSGDPERFGVFAQLAPPWMVATGHLTLAQETWDAQGRPSTAPAAPNGLAPDDAISTIVEASKGRRVVMLNEAHHVPMHRAFGRRLVMALAAEGFTHLAVEGLQNEAAPDFVNDSVGKGRPTVHGGFYVREPMFGDLLRTAFESGMTVVPYETTDRRRRESPAASINARASNQARVITDVLKADPDARVLIFCGYSHLTESPRTRGEAEVRWLACRLRDALGIDPLTVSQTQYSPASSPKFDSTVYRDLFARFSPDDVIALRDANNEVWSPSPHEFDIAVVHPRLPEIAGRPGYMLLGSGRVIARVLDAWPGDAGRLFVQAVPVGESPDDAVPSDQRWVEPGDELALALRPGAYFVRVFDETAALVHEEQMLVE